MSLMFNQFLCLSRAQFSNPNSCAYYLVASSSIKFIGPVMDRSSRVLNSSAQLRRRSKQFNSSLFFHNLNCICT
nr:MAG TPA: hypothetical protein [Caudoviricetes sp.]DAF06049.1 MAG TPA: hypothetical protein [Caudoviricetes sp.]DAY90695.1 MAG TPA: hypothetical protein [Caudoviricetes sp.]